MFRSGFLWRFLLALVLLGVLAGALALGGSAIFRAGMTQGYALGMQTAATAQEGSTAVAPPAPGVWMPYAYAYPGMWGPHMFPFFAPFACLVGFLLLLFVFGGMMRFGAARRGWHGGPGGGHGPWGRPGEPGAIPPWMNEMHQRMHAEPPAAQPEPPAA